MAIPDREVMQMQKVLFISSWCRWSAIAVAPRCLDAGRKTRLTDLHRPRKKYRSMLCLGVVYCALLSGCQHVGKSGADAGIRPNVNWPSTVVAEREFPAAEVVIDERRKPSRLWLISSHEKGVAQALEFFSGERVDGVQVESIDSNFPAERLDYNFAYSFIDSSGHRYASIPGIPYTVGTDQPSIYGGWKDRKGRGHEVVLGDYLFERKIVTGPNGISKHIDEPSDVRPLFGGQSICETTAYVARTQARLQEAEPEFEPMTKIVADYSRERGCWVTLPTLAVDLFDNTILIAIGDRVIRLSSKDLSPIGSMGSVRIIDVKE